MWGSMACCATLPAVRHESEGFDSLQMYRDSIRWSSNNVAKSEWLEKAARYSLRTGDTASLLSFKIEQAYLRFSSGNYVEAFDSLILIEKKISDHVRVPSLLATDAVYEALCRGQQG